MEYYIGIDIGTSSVKLLLMEETGMILKQESEEYKVSQPQYGWKEIEPELWFEAVKKGMKRLLALIDGRKVKGIGITGQMHTTIFIDKNGSSIRPAIMWNDMRTKEMISDLKKEINSCDEISYISKIISTGSPASNLYWMKKKEMEQFQKIKKFLIGPDYIVWRLTGNFGTDYCEASTSSLFDLTKREWSPAMRNIIGLPEEIYPEVRGSGEIVGYLKKELTEEWNLSDDVKIIAGTGDNPAASISTGCLGGTYPVLSLGTSGVLMASREKTDFEAKGKNILFSIDGKEIYILVQGTVQSAGGSYSWFTKEILKADNFYEESKNIDISNLGKGDLIFYPHLVGEKTIYADSSIRGAFLGLGTDVTRKDMVLAVMEGICFGVKELTEKMNFTKEQLSGIRVIGGGAKSDVWMQILADILNTKVQQLDGTVGSAYGMALLAGYSCGKFSSVKEMSQKAVRVKQVFYPEKNHVQRYDEKYQKYKKIYQAMKLIFE